ncbi:MAG: pectinesterase family protein [Candidatus Ornithomonoglobus sp.]
MMKKATVIMTAAIMTAAQTGGFAADIPPNRVWTSNDTALMSAAAAPDKEAFSASGIDGYGEWTKADAPAEYIHTDGKKYSFETAFRAGSGSKTKRSFYFAPEGSCIVTVVYSASAGRPVYIYQGDTLLASGEEGIEDGIAPSISADIEDPSAGDVYVYGGSSNKDIYAVFADYYDPSVIVTYTVSGSIRYDGAADTSKPKLVFKDTKDGAEYKTDIGSSYSVELRRSRSYDIYVEENGERSKKICPALDTNRVSVGMADASLDIHLVDIVPTEISGDVTVHNVYNDGSFLDLNKVKLTFTAEDDPQLTYTTGITDNKIDLTLMPDHKYDITAENIDGYELSELSKSYLMAAGDTNPFKNILFMGIISETEYKPVIEVGADKEFKTIGDALTVIKKMKRPEGEMGRLTIKLDPGVYTEQVIIDVDYVTLAAADISSRPEIRWYYGIGYLYYSADDTMYYNEDNAVAKTEKKPVTRWGAVCRITGRNINVENVIFRNTLNCEVTAEELSDGVEPALHNEYSDTNGKPDRTAPGYDAMAKAATERAAAIALDGDNIELFNCDFISSQDTFYTNCTAYVKNCYIEGNTDYIYGGNSVVFEDCTLAWHGYSDQSVGGYITACKTSGTPQEGKADLSANGYLLRNCTVTNSGYYPGNIFAVGSWGRNWGGENCRVIYDGIKLDGVDTPTEWVKMGGELSNSILYVNNVTDRDGNAVDTESFNPNGTMEQNGIEIMPDSGYFGEWIPTNLSGGVKLIRIGYDENGALVGVKINSSDEIEGAVKYKTVSCNDGIISD